MINKCDILIVLWRSLITIVIILALVVCNTSADVEYNGSDNWAGLSGTMLEHGDGNLRAPPSVTTGLVSYYSFETGSGDILFDVWGTSDGSIYPGATFSNNGDIEGGMYFNGSGYVNFGYAEALNLSSEFTLDYRETDTNSHQGVAYDGTHYYTFDTSIIYKYNLSWGLVTSNNSILDATPSAIDNHLGDGVELNGLLYIPAEYWENVTSNSDKSIVVVNATDLTYVTSYNINSTLESNTDVAGIGTDGTILYIVSYTNGSYIWKYDLVGNYLGLITLSSSISELQGITYNQNDDVFYISSDLDNYIHLYETDGSKGARIFNSGATSLEGIDYDSSNNKLFVLEDFGVNESVTTLNKPSSFTNGYTIFVSLNGSSAATEQAILARYEYDANKRQRYDFLNNDYYNNRIGTGASASVCSVDFITNEYNTYTSIWNSTDDKIYVERGTTSGNSATFTSVLPGFYQQTALGRLIDTPVTAYYTGYMDELYIYNVALSPIQRNEIRNNYHVISSYMKTDMPTDAGLGQVWKYITISGIDAGTNTTKLLQINGSHDNVTFNGLETVSSTYNLNDTITIPISKEYRYIKIKFYQYISYQPDTDIITQIELVSSTASIEDIEEEIGISGGGGGRLGPIVVEKPVYPLTYDIPDITIKSNIEVDLFYFYALVIGICCTIVSSKKEGWEVITIISFVAVVISLIKLGWI